MASLQWEVTAQPSAEDGDRVAQGVFAYGRSLASEGNAKPIGCFARDDGLLVAGAIGRTEFERLFVASLWVAENLRGRGLGTTVLLKLEDAATQQGCRSSLLETLSDRTARLYARLGYETVAEIRQYVGPFNRHIMIKALRSVA